MIGFICIRNYFFDSFNSELVSSILKKSFAPIAAIAIIINAKDIDFQKPLSNRIIANIPKAALKA